MVLTTTHNTLFAKWNAPSMGKYSQFNIKLKLGSETVEKHNISESMKKFGDLMTAASYTVIVYIINGHVNGPSVERSIFTRESRRILLTCVSSCAP